ncbi:N-acylneuraminate cytidylyltransferase-like [Agrilus planipennis]|uniref:N-acylneuraminate cytidylyltransferase-like n=1 Tax=Agrilus planipennis TaxID=224129 RepID=A0A7F5RDN9_AGRPL|nr:N-acylneuraminate cytidylyltransferase-like [Agrilus planipennis]
MLILERISNKINIHWRSEETATDHATSLSATREFLLLHPEIDKIILIQVTSPFINEKYLQHAVNEMQHYECVFSVTRSFKLRWNKTGKGILPINFDPKRRPRRQDWDGELIENGMFYGAKREMIMNGYFQTDKLCRNWNALPTL